MQVKNLCYLLTYSWSHPQSLLATLLTLLSFLYVLSTVYCGRLQDLSAGELALHKSNYSFLYYRRCFHGQGKATSADDVAVSSDKLGTGTGQTNGTSQRNQFASLSPGQTMGLQKGKEERKERMDTHDNWKGAAKEGGAGAKTFATIVAACNPTPEWQRGAGGGTEEHARRYPA